MTGLYRYGRNPMCLGVLLFLVGEVLFCRSSDLLLYSIASWVFLQLNVVLYEEPTLRRTFGASCDRYRSAPHGRIPGKKYCAILIVGLVASVAALDADRLVTYRVTPHDTDSSIGRFDTPHYVVFDENAPASADLLLFLSGTGGSPTGVSDFLNIAAMEGHRVVSLAYNDVPAVVAVCPQDPDPACSARVRQKRVFGDDVTKRIDDTPAESIVNRLTKLLITLDRDHPSEGWGGYLDNGAPKWDRIAVAGHSQGAGMAAYIAQKTLVCRVILFSSPWDFYGRDRQLAPWVLAGPGTTPPDRWFGAYHKKENTAALIAQAYKALKIPEAHIRVFTLEPAHVVGTNPYHLSVVGNGTTPRDGSGAPSYADDWRFLLGTSR